MARNQPAKLAAQEGLYKTEKGAPLLIFGIPDSKQQTVKYAFGIPKLLSFLSFGNADAEVKGLDQVKREDWPNVPAVFMTYHVMVGMWCLMFILCIAALFYWLKGQLFERRWLLGCMTVSVLFPQIANECGWVSAEMGRYPWIVQGLLRISEGLSKSVTAEQVLGSIILFGVVYFFLFILFIYLLHEKIVHGPSEEDKHSPYHHLKEFAEEIKG